MVSACTTECDRQIYVTTERGRGAAPGRNRQPRRLRLVRISRALAVRSIGIDQYCREALYERPTLWLGGACASRVCLRDGPCRLRLRSRGRLSSLSQLHVAATRASRY